jgi:hypothetical protein
LRPGLPTRRVVPPAADLAEVDRRPPPRSRLVHEGEGPRLRLAGVAILRCADRPLTLSLLGSADRIRRPRRSISTAPATRPSGCGVAARHGPATVAGTRVTQHPGRPGLWARSPSPSTPGRRCSDNKKRPAKLAGRKTNSGGDLLSQALASQVPSALRGLTTLFGKGRGGSPSP